MAPRFFAYFSAQRPARDRVLPSFTDSPPRRTALCAESVGSGSNFTRSD
jgi:hypothetical protein